MATLTTLPLFTLRYCTMFLAVVVLSLLSSKSSAAISCKQLFDGTLYRGKPSLRQFGFQEAVIVDPLTWWGKGEPKNAMTKSQGIEAWAKGSHRAEIVVLDNETWTTRGDAATVDNSLHLFGKTIDRLRAAGLGKVVGYYGVLPNRDYWRAIRGEGTREYAAWQAENDLLRPLSDKVDAIFPSLYTLYNDRATWPKYAIANLREARRLGAGKPVYAFLWPQFHENAREAAGKYLSAEFWATEMNIALTHADGVVIWGGWQQPWDNDAGWWQTTLATIAKYPICAPPPIPKPPQPLPPK